MKIIVERGNVPPQLQLRGALSALAPGERSPRRAIEANTMTLENKEYARRGRERNRAQGGKHIALMLSPEATTALENLKRKLGQNGRGVIEAALIALDKHTAQ
jgi:hypothetical protein